MKLLSVVILGFAFMTSSCIQDQGSHNDCKEMNNQVEERIVAEMLKRQIINFLEDTKNYDSTEMNYVLSLEFLIDSEYTSPSSTEEVLILSSLGCSYDSMAYMGSFLISNTLVTVFDRNRKGDAFYNYEKLMNIPVQCLRCEQTEMRVARSFIIRDTLLIHWH